MGSSRKRLSTGSSRERRGEKIRKKGCPLATKSSPTRIIVSPKQSANHPGARWLLKVRQRALWSEHTKELTKWFAHCYLKNVSDVHGRSLCKQRNAYRALLRRHLFQGSQVPARACRRGGARRSSHPRTREWLVSSTCLSPENSSVKLK